jgi:hypothetical protein
MRQDSESPVSPFSMSSKKLDPAPGLGIIMKGHFDDEPRAVARFLLMLK